MPLIDAALCSYIAKHFLYKYLWKYTIQMKSKHFGSSLAGRENWARSNRAHSQTSPLWPVSVICGYKQSLAGEDSSHLWETGQLCLESTWLSQIKGRLHISALMNKYSTTPPSTVFTHRKLPFLYYANVSWLRRIVSRPVVQRSLTKKLDKEAH